MSWLRSPLRCARGRMNRGADALVGSATADVGHRCVDIGIGRLRVGLEQRSCGHHHAALAIAALRHVEVEPGLLHRVQLAVLGERLDGGDLLAADGADRDLARARGDAVDVHGAGAALRDAAAVFGAGQSDRIADDPEQWRVGFNVDVVRLSVDGKGNHTVLPVAWCASPYGTDLSFGAHSWVQVYPVPIRMRIAKSRAGNWPGREFSNNLGVYAAQLGSRRARDARGPGSRSLGRPVGRRWDIRT